MWAQSTSDALNALERAKTEPDAFAGLVNFIHAIGADLVSYRQIGTPSAPTRPSAPADEFPLMIDGFSPEWIEQYKTNNYRQIDPIIAFSAYQTRPVIWSTVPDLIQLNAAQRDYMDALYAWLAPGDGMAIPLFGPSGHHGYIAIGWTAPIKLWTPVQIRLIQSVCESFHLRICELRLAGLERDFDLTDVQHRILRAMASGQPDALICGLVNLRPDALQSAITRLLTTMGVSDRPSALIRARGLGLLTS